MQSRGPVEGPNCPPGFSFLITLPTNQCRIISAPPHWCHTHARDTHEAYTQPSSRTSGSAATTAPPYCATQRRCGARPRPRRPGRIRDQSTHTYQPEARSSLRPKSNRQMHPGRSSSSQSTHVHAGQRAASSLQPRRRLSRPRTRAPAPPLQTTHTGPSANGMMRTVHATSDRSTHANPPCRTLRNTRPQHAHPEHGDTSNKSRCSPRASAGLFRPQVVHLNVNQYTGPLSYP